MMDITNVLELQIINKYKNALSPPSLIFSIISSDHHASSSAYNLLL